MMTIHSFSDHLAKEGEKCGILEVSIASYFDQAANFICLLYAGFSIDTLHYGKIVDMLLEMKLSPTDRIEIIASTGDTVPKIRKL